MADNAPLSDVTMILSSGNVNRQHYVNDITNVSIYIREAVKGYVK
jgi:hypothetical protein